MSADPNRIENWELGQGLDGDDDVVISCTCLTQCYKVETLVPRTSSQLYRSRSENTDWCFWSRSFFEARFDYLRSAVRPSSERDSTEYGVNRA